MRKMIVTIALAVFCVNMQAQSGMVWDISLHTPIYMGGKGKQLIDGMLGISFERPMWDNKNVIFMGIGFISKVLPNRYDGTVQFQKYDYGSFNQSLPATIDIDYYVRQKKMGLELALDFRHYMKAYSEPGLYFSIGAGFDYLSFESHVEAYDSYNYYPDNTNYPETPSTVLTNYQDSTRAFATGALNLRGGLGFTIRMGEYSLIFVECIAGYRPSGNAEAIDYIYNRKIMFTPGIGLKLFWGHKKEVI